MASSRTAVRQFKLSNDPKFVEKLRDVVGLYVDSPAHAIVLSFDEKSQIQALDRTQPGLPLRGVNKQSYELWEYKQMFEAANLDVVSVQIDVGSLKIALRPRRDTNDHVTDYPNLSYAHGSEF